MANVSESFRTKHNSFGELKIFAKPLLRKPTLFNEKDTLHPTDTTWA